jgi:hypothetical protein
MSTLRDFLEDFSETMISEVGDDVSLTLTFELCVFFLLKKSKYCIWLFHHLQINLHGYIGESLEK